MRRLMMCSILLLAVFGDLFATLSSVDFRGFQITAQRGGIQEVSITPIEAISLDDDVGIPFDLEDESVAYSAATDAVIGKRHIANWSMYSNLKDPKVTIDAPHLKHEGTGVTVPYQMAFYFQFPGEEGKMIDGNIIVDSGIPYDSSKDEDRLWQDYLVNFTDRPVRLMLGDKNVKDDSVYPPGRYSAVVTVTISGT